MEATTRWSRGVAAPGRPWSKVRAVHAICVVFWPCDIALHLGTSKKRGGGPPQSRARLNTTEQASPRGSAAGRRRRTLTLLTTGPHRPLLATRGTAPMPYPIRNTSAAETLPPIPSESRRRPTLDESGRVLPPSPPPGLIPSSRAVLAARLSVTPVLGDPGTMRVVLNRSSSSVTCVGKGTRAPLQTASCVFSAAHASSM